jgi:hypothetical protein
MKAANGATPVYYAAQQGKLNVLKFLITDAKANCKIRANDGMTAAHAATQCGHLDCLKFLVITMIFLVEYVLGVYSRLSMVEHLLWTKTLMVLPYCTMLQLQVCLLSLMVWGNSWFANYGIQDTLILHNGCWTVEQ